MSDSAKERNKIVVECPHCVKVGQLANMKRWHFDKCKEKNGTSGNKKCE